MLMQSDVRAFESNLPLTLHSPMRVALLTDGGVRTNGELIEISPLDVKLRCQEVFPVRTFARMHLQDSGRQHSIPCKGHVHWRAEWEDGMEYGFYLEEPLQVGEVHQFWNEMRREVRYDGRWRVAVKAGWFSKASAGIVRNYSRSGVLVEVPKLLATEAKIELIVADVNIPAVVRWSATAHPSGFLAGCELQRESGIVLGYALHGELSE